MMYKLFSSRKGAVVFAVLLLAVCYSSAFALEYMADYLGLSPVLDGRENLAWGELIAIGEVPAEPLYRALLYPWLLSFFLNGGLWLVTVFGLLCHLLNAYLVGLLAERLWRTDSAARFAGAVYAVYPVALYFSVQVLDITFSLSLFLGAVVFSLRIGELRTRGHDLFLASFCGLLGGLAVLARPNFLPAVLLLPLLPIVNTYFSGRRRLSPGWGSPSIIFCGLLFTLLGQATWNQRKSGEFRILPWQGAYNLYAANREGANGKFYKQRVSFNAVPAGMNTTRMESEYLYYEAQGEGAELDIGAMSTYWRAELLRDIAGDPLRWIGLMGKKVVYLMNDWEQYNNLTYAYHKERFLLLKWNPLGWGVLCLGALCACLLNWKRVARAPAVTLALLFAAYAAGVLLFFVSARFRLPLAPLLCVFCGGLTGVTLNKIRLMSRQYVCISSVVLLLATALAYGNWFDARNENTFIQDELLLAKAAAELGDDAAAYEYASAAVIRDVNRQDTRRIQVVSGFNLWMLETEHERKSTLWNELRESLGQLSEFDAPSLFVAGVVAWRDGDSSAAESRWVEAVQRYGTEAAVSAEALKLVERSNGPDEPSHSESDLSRLLFIHD